MAGDQEDAWIILNGDALDVTKWIPIHPGGEQVGKAMFFQVFAEIFHGFSAILGKICCRILPDLGK